MQVEQNWTTNDKEKVIEFLNSVASSATFEMNTQDLIKYFRLLNFMQSTLLPKIEAHIFELQKIVPATKKTRAKE